MVVSSVSGDLVFHYMYLLLKKKKPDSYKMVCVCVLLEIPIQKQVSLK